MSEILLAVSLWFTVFLQARDPYYGRNKLLLGLFIAFAAGYSVYSSLQIGSPEFIQAKSFPLYMAVWMPLFTWAYGIRAQAVIDLHGEASLHRKYGAPKLKLEQLSDQRLAKMIRLSQYGLWGFVLVFVVERIFTYVQITA